VTAPRRVEGLPAKPQTVVGAVIVDGGRVLAARRAHPDGLAGRWEFPGGKVEGDEAPREALIREIHEELSATIAVTAEVPGDGSPWRISANYELRLYLASVLDGEPRAGTDHDELRWLAADELGTVDWLPSDRRALPAVRSALRGGLTAPT
jgi:8-oxo-dGTP diphosphatase